MGRKRTGGGLACVAAAAAVVAASCGGGGGSPSSSNRPNQAQSGSTASAPTTAAAPAPNSVIVGERDFALDAPVAKAASGSIDFNVANQGPSAHEFLIFKTDLLADKLPLGTDGRVDEANTQISKVFDSENNIDPNGAKTFHVTLAAGHYVLVCNLAPSHYTAGMHTAFTVS
jgi:uncharacterized cupredoxin-like copper-binding protein